MAPRIAEAAEEGLQPGDQVGLQAPGQPVKLISNKRPAADPPARVAADIPETVEDLEPILVFLEDRLAINTTGHPMGGCLGKIGSGAVGT